MQIHAGKMSSIFEQSLGDMACDAALVLIEVSDGYQSLDKAHGLEISYQLAREGKKVLMLGWKTPAMYASNPLWHTCMATPGISFAQLPLSLAEIKKLLENLQPVTPIADPLALRLLELDAEVDVIKMLKHDLSNFEHRGEESNQRFEAKARELFGNLPLEELKAKVAAADEDASVNTCAGEEFPGVFIDIEDTLLVNGELNRELLAQIDQLAAEKPVTIWSGGDLKELIPMLRKAGIAYKIVSKHALRGAKVEVAFDNQPYEEFVSQYGIEVAEYHQV